MPGNSVVRDKTNERHGLLRGIESCDIADYGAPSAHRQYSESRYGTLKSSKAPTNYFTPNILRKSWSRLVVSVVHLDALAFPVAAM